MAKAKNKNSIKRLFDQSDKEALRAKYESKTKLSKPEKPSLPKKPKKTASLESMDKYLERVQFLNDKYNFELSLFNEMKKRKAEKARKVDAITRQIRNF